MIEVPYLPPRVIGGKDYSGRFVAIGVLMIAVTLGSACLTSAVPLAWVMQHRFAAQIAAANSQPNGHMVSTMPQTPNGQLLTGMLLYLALTVTAGWLAIGALLKRRWLRPLLIVLSTHALILGSVTCGSIGVMAPLMMDQFKQQGQLGSGPALVGLIFGAVLAVLLMIVLPATLLLLARSDGLRVTAEHYDLRRRWTDGLPLKLVGLIVTLAVVALLDLVMLGQAVVPMFTTVLTGPAAIVLLLTDAAVLMAAAVLVHRRDARGWSLGLAGVVLPLLLFFSASLMMPLDRYYAALGTPADTVRMMREHEATFRIVWTATLSVFIVTFVLYMLRVRPLVTAVAGTEG